MALFDTTWYVNDGDNSTTGWWAVGAWNNNAGAGRAWTAGQFVRQSGTPTVGNERVYVCIVAGTGGTGADPLTTFTRGVKIADGTATWQECTGASAVNGDVTNTPVWTLSTAYTLGQIIKRVNAASYWICSTAGTSGGSEPAWANDNAGTTRTDGASLIWTCLGVVGNFTGWQAPHARLANAFTSTWGQAGNAFYVSDTHAETQAANLTLSSPGTTGSPCFVYCVNHSGSLPPVSADLMTTATITANGAFSLIVNKDTYYYGITFDCSNGNSSNVALQFSSGGASGAAWQRFDNCKLKETSTHTSGQIVFGSQNSANPSKIELVNTTLNFGATAQGIQLQYVNLSWRNTASALTGSVPSSLFKTANNAAIAQLVGVDLSSISAGNTLVAALPGNINFSMVDCKLAASVTVAATPTNRAGATTDLVRCDSGATNYRDERYWYEGTQSVETTIVRTGGATDGTTAIAWKLVTTANSKWLSPFVSQPITIWNDGTSAMTIVVYGNYTSVPNDDDIWMEVEYLGSSLTPMGSFKTSTKADNLAASAATNNTSDSSTWASGTTAFKITSPSFTPGQKGPINITIKAAKASQTFYIDPRPAITGISVSKSAILAPGICANERANPAMLVNNDALVR